MKLTRLFIDQALTGKAGVSDGIADEIAAIAEKTGLTPEPVADPAQVYDTINQADEPIGFAKQVLFITANKGAIIRACPGTSHYTCCDYTILHTGTFCTMDCSYCILQAYFHPPVLQYFAGLSTLTSALQPVFSGNDLLRIGTGEYTDSLIWEPVTPMPAFLVDQFSTQDRAVLELKTKTVNVSSLLEKNPQGKTILAWSVNTPEVIRAEERGTASLTARLETAKKCAAKGYRLAFHFDPLIIYQGCGPAYEAVIETIFTHVDPKDVVWISLGTFRFMPQLKSVIQTRFPDSVIPFGEFILGLDNKMRYFKPQRIRLYQRLAAKLKETAPGVFAYYCMEDQEVWEKTFGFFPGKQGELAHLLNQAAVEKCGLDHGLL